MDKKILELLQKLKADINDIKKVMATKDDLKKFATKQDLDKFATKDDLKHFATKDDLLKMENRLLREIRDSESFVTVNADTHKADKIDLKALEERVEIIEQKIAN